MVTVLPPPCQKPADVGFILDSSGSLTNHYDTEKEFVKALASAYNISSSQSRVGVITFSTNAEHSIKMNDHYTMPSFETAVDNIPFYGGLTRIDLALRLAQQKMFTVENGARPELPNIIILLTDGSQTVAQGSEDPATIADELRVAGITIVVVGIGSLVDPSELLRIGSSQDYVYNAASFNDLVSTQFVHSVTNKTCDIGKNH